MRTMVILAALAAASGMCPAAVVYDSIPIPPYNNYPASYGVGSNTGELAQDVLLANGAGATLESVALLLRNALGTYNGPVWAGLYTNSAGQPGTLIASSTSSVQLASGQTLPISFDFTGVEVPAAMWVSFRYEVYPQLAIVGGVWPSVGTTQGRQAVRTFGTGTWFTSNASSFGIRITAVPGPGAGAVMLAGVMLARRRR